MTYVVLETGGKQYRCQPGGVLKVEKLPYEEGEVFEFDKVLLVNRDGVVRVGRPYLEGASVKAKVLSHGKHDKVLVFKFKRKKNYRRNKSHRQPYTEVEILEVNG